MRAKTRISILGVCLAVLFSFSFTAQAQNTICDNAIFLVPDGSAHTETFTADNQDRFFRFGGRANRSYAIMSENLSTSDVDPSAGGQLTLTDACGGSTVTSNLISFIEPNPRNGVSIWTRRAVVLTTDTDVFIPIRGDAGAAARIRVEETTLFNPAWSTFGTFETFYSCTNATNSGTLDATLMLFNTAGAQVASFTFIDVPAGGTVSRNTSVTSLNVADNLNGSAVLTHNGPPGAFICEAALADFVTSPRVIQPVKFQRRNND